MMWLPVLYVATIFLLDRSETQHSVCILSPHVNKNIHLAFNLVTQLIKQSETILTYQIMMLVTNKLDLLNATRKIAIFFHCGWKNRKKKLTEKIWWTFVRVYNPHPFFVLKIDGKKCGLYTTVYCT